MMTLLVVAAASLCAFAHAVDVGAGAESTFYKPPAGSIAEVQAQEMYFSRSTKIILGLQEAYHWASYGQLEAIKAYKSGIFDSASSAGMAMEEEAGCLAESATGECNEGKQLKIPAIPKNKALAGYMKTNAPRMLEEFHLGDADTDQLENMCTYTRLAALKTMQIQVFTASSDVQKSYWTTKLMQTMAPPQLTYFMVLKSFLSTVSLSVMMQLQDSFTLYAYLDNFNDEFGYDDAAQDVAGYQTYSSWTAIAGIKLAMLFIDYSEMQTTMQAMQTMTAASAGTIPMAMSQQVPVQPAPAIPAMAPTVSLSSLGTAENTATTQQEENPNVDVSATVVAEAPTSEEPAAVEGAQSLLEVELKAEPSEHKFTAAGNPLQTYAVLQQYTSLLKIYNLMVEFQLANVGMTSQTYKIMENHMQDDGFGGKLGQHAELLDGLYLPQLYMQWGQINIFLQFMDIYQFQTEMSISMMSASAAGAAAGTTPMMSMGQMENAVDFSAQMRSVQATNVMESLNF